MSWFIAALKKYAVFRGRAQRKEYWFFILFYLIFMVVAFIVDAVLGTEYYVDEFESIGLFATFYSLAMIVPSLAVTVRRLHDVGRSGWWILISLIPLIGGIVIFVFMVLDSHEGENRFGPNPKEVAVG